ncbi:MAG: glycosyltransferase family 1 protein [Anaerolineaceae bacterium]|nr:glycosyltransferase family 1 protein [Anaerolineaceae bacterium]
MDHFSIITVVPRLPPAIDGVGDYALNLARQLRQDFNIHTQFVVGDPTWIGAAQIEEFPVSRLSAQSELALLVALSNSPSLPILLHYVGYGYAKRGCPTWLIKGLQQWITRKSKARLVTMFHELYASGRIWTSTFWLSNVQKNLIRMLVNLSTEVISSKQLFADILIQLSQGKYTTVPTLPVFSNIGEPQLVPPLADRKRQMVVFGGSENRLRVYQQSLQELEYACELLEIKEILDIGPPTDLPQNLTNGLPIRHLGQQPAEKISSIMLNAYAGFFNYPTNLLAKSTIFAAYCAHAVLPINGHSMNKSADGLSHGMHFWQIANQNKLVNGEGQAQLMADNAFRWYQAHNLPVQAKTFANYLKNGDGL